MDPFKISILALVSTTSMAEAYSLTCSNPGREYNLVYEQGMGAAIINPDSEKTQWPVLASILDDRQHVVFVNIGNENMAAIIHLRPYKKIEIFQSGSIIQTDGCHE